MYVVCVSLYLCFLFVSFYLSSAIETIAFVCAKIWTRLDRENLDQTIFWKLQLLLIIFYLHYAWYVLAGEREREMVGGYVREL